MSLLQMGRVSFVEVVVPQAEQSTSSSKRLVVLVDVLVVWVDVLSVHVQVVDVVDSRLVELEVADSVADVVVSVLRIAWGLRASLFTLPLMKKAHRGSFSVACPAKSSASLAPLAPLAPRLPSTSIPPKLHAAPRKLGSARASCLAVRIRSLHCRGHARISQPGLMSSARSRRSFEGRGTACPAHF